MGSDQYGCWAALFFGLIRRVFQLLEEMRKEDIVAVRRLC